MPAATSNVEFSVGSPHPRALDVRWIHGSPSPKHNTDPDIQVYEYDEHTVILRQNMAVHYEAPFLYLLFGNDRCVLIDTGATPSAEYFPLRSTVDGAIHRWLAAHPRDRIYPLVVVHTHPHGDHVAADGQFADRPDTHVVPAHIDSSWPYFGFDTSPDAIARLDLGARILECLATPGHHQAAVTYYDPHTGILLTGDTVYPGRLYVFDWAAFDRSIDRLIEFCATRPVTHVLGCHIEMSTTPGVDYPMGLTYQPDEPPLELIVEHLHRIRATIDENDHRPGRYVLPDLIISPI